MFSLTIRVMRKTLVFLKLFVFVLILVVVFPKKSVLADFREKILGAETEQTNVVIPPTTEGPGFILPNSPFYFLDNLKQAVRVAMATTPKDKAKVYKDIAGERYAELRFMLAKGDKQAVEKTLQDVSDNLKKASGEVSQAKMLGADVTDLARTVNTDIKEKQESLDLLDKETRGELKERVSATLEGLTLAKVKTEDALPPQEIENERSYDLNRQVEKQIDETARLNQSLREDVDEMVKQASEAAQRSMQEKQEALKKSIEAKNQVLQKEQERLLLYEKKKNDILQEMEAKEAKQAMETAKVSSQAAEKFRMIQKTVKELRNTLATPSSVVFPKITPTPVATTGD